MAEESNKEETRVIDKKLMLSNVRGSVKWFSVRSGYGFIHRDDLDEDIFVHSSSIVRPKDQTTRYYLSVRQGENVQFDVVQGEKGLEASSVVGADGVPLKSGEYSFRFRGRGRSRGWRGNQNYDRIRTDPGEGPNSRGDGYISYQNESPDFYRGGRGRGGRGPRSFAGGMFVRGGGGYGGYGYDGYNYPPMPFRVGRGGFRGRPMYNDMGYAAFGPIVMGDMQSYRGGRRGGSRSRGYRTRGSGRGRNAENNEKYIGSANNGEIHGDEESAKEND